MIIGEGKGANKEKQLLAQIDYAGETYYLILERRGTKICVIDMKRLWWNRGEILLSYIADSKRRTRLMSEIINLAKGDVGRWERFRAIHGK